MRARPRLSARAAPAAVVAPLLLCACFAARTTAPTTPERPNTQPVSNDADELGPGSRYATEAEHRIVSELMGVAERIRSLRFKARIPTVVEDATAIRRYISSQLEEDELQRARQTYVALGLLPPEMDVRGMLLRVMGEQVMGYYDPKRRRLVIRDSVMEAFAQHAASGGGRRGPRTADLLAARSVIIHELVHALQDQHLGLGEALELERTTDAASALRALVEGDANLAMLANEGDGGVGALRRLTRDTARVGELAELVRQPPPADSELGRAPAIVRVPLLSAYSDGLVFAAHLHGRGSWAGVDAAHRRPPASMEQVLHPESYTAGELPIELEAPSIPALERAGYTALPEDTLGELELRIFFAHGGTPADLAARAAAGWGGDALRIYLGPKGERVALWLLAWDRVVDAQEAAKLARSQQQRLPPATRAMAAVLHGGRRVLVVRGLPRAYHTHLPSLLDRAGTAH